MVSSWGVGHHVGPGGRVQGGLPLSGVTAYLSRELREGCWVCPVRLAGKMQWVGSMDMVAGGDTGFWVPNEIGKVSP